MISEMDTALTSGRVSQSLTVHHPVCLHVEKQKALHVCMLTGASLTESSQTTGWEQHPHLTDDEF